MFATFTKYNNLLRHFCFWSAGLIPLDTLFATELWSDHSAAVKCSDVVVVWYSSVKIPRDGVVMTTLAFRAVTLCWAKGVAKSSVVPSFLQGVDLCSSTNEWHRLSSVCAALPQGCWAPLPSAQGPWVFLGFPPKKEANTVRENGNVSLLCPVSHRSPHPLLIKLRSSKTSPYLKFMLTLMAVVWNSCYPACLKGLDFQEGRAEVSLPTYLELC